MNIVDNQEIAVILEKCASMSPLKAYQNAIRAEEMALRIGDKQAYAESQSILVQILIKNGAYQEALERSLNSLNYYDHLGQKYDKAICFKHIAVIYALLGDCDKQLIYNQKCLSLIEEEENVELFIKVYNNIGDCYLRRGEYDTAQKYFEKNLVNPQLCLSLKCVTLKNLGKVFFYKDGYVKSLEYFDLSLEVAEQLDSTMYKIPCYFFIGKICVIKNEIEKALSYLGQSHILSEQCEIGKSERIQMLESYIQTLVKAGKTESLANLIKVYARLNKEANSKIKSNAIESLRFKFGITEIEKERSLLEKKNQQLELAYKQIEIQKEALETKGKQLIQVNQDLQSFAHVVSHDLKQPLRTISSFIGLLTRSLGDDLTDRSKGFLEIVVKSAKEMSVFVDDILSYSEADHSADNKELIDCNYVLSAVQSNLQAQLEQANASLVFKNLASVHSNKSLLIQVFQNLISNAIKFRKQEVAPVVKIYSQKKSNSIVFHIEDNGIGIKEEDQPKVFQVFTRLNKRSEYEGNGIGLSTVMKVIKRLGGEISLRSTYGEGTTFSISFPNQVNE